MNELMPLGLIVDGDVDVEGDVGVVVPVQAVVVSLLRAEQFYSQTQQLLIRWQCSVWSKQKMYKVYSSHCEFSIIN